MSCELAQLIDRYKHLLKLNPAANSESIQNRQKILGVSLPTDLIDFLGISNGAKIIGKNENNYRILSIENIKMTRIDIFGEDSDKVDLASFFSVMDVMDGDYVAYDVNSGTYIDCFHETFGVPGEGRIIAYSFVELLRNSLQSPNELYWLRDDYSPHGYI